MSEDDVLLDQLDTMIEQLQADKEAALQTASDHLREIERLRASNAELVAALKLIASDGGAIVREQIHAAIAKAEGKS